MAYTKDDLVREIVADLTGLATGQPPNPEDAARVEALLPAVISELSGLNVIYIADADSVPEAAFKSVVSYAAEAMAYDFLRAPNEAKQTAAENKLRTLQRLGRGTGQMLRVDRALSSRRWGC